MKKVLIKIPAMLAMIITLFSFILYCESLIDPMSEGWLGAVMIALFSMPFYFADAIISFVKAIKKNDAKFNFILTAVLIVAIPMYLFVGNINMVVPQILWHLYYLAMFVLEVISIKRCVKS